MFRTVLDLFTRYAIQLIEGGNAVVTSKDAGISANRKLLLRQAIILVEWSKGVGSGVHGPEALPGARGRDLLKRRLDDVAATAMSKFYAYRYDELPIDWRDIYADSLALAANTHLLEAADSPGTIKGCVFDDIVALLDRIIITTCNGRAEHARQYEEMLLGLENLWKATDVSDPESGGHREKVMENAQNERQSKRRRVRWPPEAEDSFPLNEPFGRPKIDANKRCPIISGWSMDEFESMMNNSSAQPKPLVFADLMTGWPALAEHPWRSPSYLLSKTFGGRRLVPVEIGRSYVDDGWGQELVRFRDFLDRYILRVTAQSRDEEEEKAVGYLAQHNLFDQIPSLRSDVLVPDYCWTNVPPHPHDSSKNQPALDAPQLNAWFGPAKTITPLHTDAYHNLLCQAVGTKYVRLYAPDLASHLIPRGHEDGIDMSNTSTLDLGVLEGWDEPPEGMDAEILSQEQQRVKDIPYWECVLKEGDTLLIPMGWWHYVRSLSVSFSVSFWWN